MEYQYKKALVEYDLTENDLPEDAQHGIEQIKQIEKAIKMTEKTGKMVSQKTIKKVKTFDKWVYYEILDFVNDTDNNPDDSPVDADEINKEINAETSRAKESEVINPIGAKIDEELRSLYNSNKTKLDIEDIESEAPTTYDVLFDTYNERDEENGIETSYFRLVETPDEKFTLTKR
jgi:hypothetical protein